MSRIRIKIMRRRTKTLNQRAGPNFSIYFFSSFSSRMEWSRPGPPLPLLPCRRYPSSAPPSGTSPIAHPLSAAVAWPRSRARAPGPHLHARHGRTHTLAPSPLVAAFDDAWVADKAYHEACATLRARRPDASRAVVAGAARLAARQRKPRRSLRWGRCGPSRPRSYTMKLRREFWPVSDELMGGRCLAGAEIPQLLALIGIRGLGKMTFETENTRVSGVCSHGPIVFLRVGRF